MSSSSPLSDLKRRREAAAWLHDRILELSPRPRAVAIFGSFAGEKLHETSDIDILLVGDEIPRRPSKRSAWFAPVIDAWRGRRPFPEYPRTLSPLYLSEQGWLDSIGLRLSLSSQAWVLEDDGLLSESLDEARRWIARGEWTRKELRNGGWLWIPSGEAA